MGYYGQSDIINKKYIVTHRNSYELIVTHKILYCGNCGNWVYWVYWV